MLGCPSSRRWDVPGSRATAVSTELLSGLSGLPSSAYQRGALQAPPVCGLSGLRFFLRPWERPRWAAAPRLQPLLGDGRWVRSGAGRRDALKRSRASTSLEHALRRGTAGPRGHFMSHSGNFEEAASSRAAAALCFRTSRVGRCRFLHGLRRACLLCLHAQSRPGGRGQF